MVPEHLTPIDDFYIKTLSEITLKKVLFCKPDTPVFKAAQIMRDEKSSCLFVGNNIDEIEGVITDITLRDNVMAI